MILVQRLKLNILSSDLGSLQVFLKKTMHGAKITAFLLFVIRSVHSNFVIMAPILLSRQISICEHKI